MHRARVARKVGERQPGAHLEDGLPDEAVQVGVGRLRGDGHAHGADLPGLRRRKVLGVQRPAHLQVCLACTAHGLAHELILHSLLDQDQSTVNLQISFSIG